MYSVLCDILFYDVLFFNLPLSPQTKKESPKDSFFCFASSEDCLTPGGGYFPTLSGTGFADSLLRSVGLFETNLESLSLRKEFNQKWLDSFFYSLRRFCVVDSYGYHDLTSKQFLSIWISMSETLDNSMM